MEKRVGAMMQYILRHFGVEAGLIPVAFTRLQVGRPLFCLVPESLCVTDELFCPVFRPPFSATESLCPPGGLPLRLRTLRTAGPAVLSDQTASLQPRPPGDIPEHNVSTIALIDVYEAYFLPNNLEHGINTLHISSNKKLLIYFDHKVAWLP